MEPSEELARQAHAAWERNGVFWDERMGEGNAFYHQLIRPAVERLLEPRAGQRLLDVACGNGLFSRRLASLGATVVACDFSESLLERARARTVEHAERTDYRRVDATQREQLLALGRRSFDAVVCNMALMDMVTLEPLAAALPELLVPGGRFVFSVLHPCFNNPAASMSLEEEDREGELVEVRSVRVKGYLEVPPRKGLGMANQPVPHYYFHRPLGELLGTFFRQGFVLDGLEEPAFAGASTAAGLSWLTFRGIPPVLVARLRLGAG